MRACFAFFKMQFIKGLQYRAAAWAGEGGRAAIRREWRGRRGAAFRDRLAHDSGGDLRPDRQRRELGRSIKEEEECGWKPKGSSCAK